MPTWARIGCTLALQSTGMPERDSPRTGHDISYFTRYTVDRTMLLIVDTTSETVSSLRIPLFVGADGRLREIIIPVWKFQKEGRSWRWTRCHIASQEKNDEHTPRSLGSAVTTV